MICKWWSLFSFSMEISSLTWVVGELMFWDPFATDSPKKGLYGIHPCTEPLNKHLRQLVVLQLLLVLQEHCCVFAWFVFDLIYHYPCLSWVSPSSQGLVQKLFYLLVKYLTPAFTVRFTAFTASACTAQAVLLHSLYNLLRYIS